jgi:hypothetical protein
LTRLDTAHYRRRCAAGDAIKLRIVLDHKANLKEVRLTFAHESDEHAAIMGRVEPRPISDRDTNASMVSRLDAEILIPRRIPPGVYQLVRISYETAGGRLGHLSFEEGLPDMLAHTFEVVREPADEPNVIDIAFVDP